MEASVSTSNKTLWKSEENTLIKDNEEGSHANKIEAMNKKMKQIRLKGWCWKVSLIRLTGRAKDLMYQVLHQTHYITWLIGVNYPN